MKATDEQIGELPQPEELESIFTGIITKYKPFLQSGFTNTHEIASLLRVRERLEQLERYMDNMVTGHSKN